MEQAQSVVVAQMALDWMVRAPMTTQAPKIAGRRHTTSRNGNQEYVDIGPFVGKRPAVDIRPGSSRCQCGRCGLAFTSVSGFDRHQRLDDGRVICLDPATVGLVFNDGWWSFPSDDRVRERFAKQEQA